MKHKENLLFAVFHHTLVRGIFEHDVHLFGVEPELYVYLFEVCLNPTYTYSECIELHVNLFGVCLNSTSLFRSVLDFHVHLLGVEPPSQTCTGRSPLASRRRRSECRGRDEKCVSNAPFSSRSGRIASGITWRRRRGAVLGSPHARAPKVSPKMVGSLLRGNDFGGNPQEGGKNISLSRVRYP